MTATKFRFRVLARHKRWVSGATITESILEPDYPDTSYRRFTATVNGWEGFLIYEGTCFPDLANKVQAAVRSIKDRIENGDDSVFSEKGPFVHE